MSEEQKVSEVPQENQEPQSNISADNDVNWKKFREERAKEREAAKALEEKARAKEEEAKALKAALESVLNKQPVVSNDESEETEEQRIAKIVDQRYNERVKQEEEARRVREMQDLPVKMQKTYPDFDKVCSQENVDYLRYKYPEIYSALNQLPDSFDTRANIYHTMKKLIPNPDSKKDAEKADKNFMKPQAISKPGMSQTGDHPPLRTTEQARMERWRDMQRRMKGV